ncbi:Clan CA, family C19, ubiquitin hydrolase-like cysteine peptidase [Trichomonas vaginalis G3]|uniref:Clan CA, family C19, ubiquitin hydrolase-like cysteine peptidase n=1 Tax=Trichomonas vaginalis (strain ATCC PRA-98 / G3) TaxID=412133 RepID=A2DGS8_TRIV3|nr:ubiquitinyl hydrolase protein [Trichomonas vaginalis G3]EAY20465.1 Clan CA, family C19, ubiquitin hydrolase-like cysteine peptidase [Trichomonas vaginalis G3]KAI5490486.1 ubiquitinyl hydrolase protein [Trichomonas vaginalis G3]|eukprot:XP_001581451.1 Clan CA, family C19, ubiquitin hydrolase-like cysteine peptidase [Trichomonas vaginalis G3]
MSDKPSKQFSGVKSICEDISKPDAKELCKILKDAQFVPELLKKLHYQIVEKFAQIVLVMAYNNYLTKEEITELWNLSIQQHSQTNDFYFKSLLNIFSSLPKEMIDTLWDIFPTSESFPLPALRFFQKIALTGTLEQRKALFTALDAYYPKIESNPEIKNDLTAALCEILPNDDNMVTTIQSKSFDLIRSQQRVEYALSLLKASSKYLSPENSRISFDQLIEIMTVDNNKTINTQFFDLIAQIMYNFNENLPESEVKSLENLLRKFIKTNPLEIIGLISKVIDKTKYKVLSIEILSYIFESFCKDVPSDKNTIDFIIFIFKKINDKYYNDPGNSPFSKCNNNISEFKGISSLWKLCFKTNNDTIPLFLCRLYGKSKDHDNIVEFVKRCMKHPKHLGSLMALLHIINLIESNRDKESLGLQTNKFISPSNFCDMNLVGDINATIKVRKDISFYEMKERLSRMMRNPKSTIEIIRDSEYMNSDSFSTDFSPLEYLIHVRKAEHVVSFKMPRVDYFPTLILTREKKYVKQLLDLVNSESDEISQASLRVLNEMCPDEKIRKSLLKIDDWKQVFDEKHKGLLMYKLHMLGNLLLKNEHNFVEQFFKTNGPTELFMFVLTKSRKEFPNFDNLRTVLQLGQFVFSMIEKPEQMKDLIQNLGQSQVENILKWSNIILEEKQTKESIEVIDALLTFLVHFAEYGEPSAFLTEQFALLFKKTIFHSKNSIRNGLVNVCKFIDKVKLEKLLIDVLPSATCNECAEYFSLLDSDNFSNKNLLFDSAKNIILGKYNFTDKDTLEILKTYSPPSIFTHHLFKLLSSLVSKIYCPVEDMKNLCIFCMNNILFNPLKYFDPTKEFFDFVFYAIKQDVSILENIMPFLGFLSQKMPAEQNVNHEVRYRGIYNPEHKHSHISTCVQQLYNIKEFRDQILIPHVTDPLWFNELQYLFAQLMLFPTTAIDPTDFITSLNWNSRTLENRLCDAGDFLSLFLERIGKIVPQLKDLYTGKVSHEVKGTSQHFKQEIVTDFILFPLEIKENKNIYQSFQTFLHPDILSGAEQYLAEGIGKIDAISYSKVTVAPKIMIFQLKRFETNLATGDRQKISSRFSFPRTLDISSIMKVVNQPVMYDLIGVTVHAGNLMPGYFYSYQKCDNDDDWRIFNDARVASISNTRLNQFLSLGETNMNNYYNGNSEQSERSDTAYLLFYRQKEFSEKISDSDVDQQILTKIVANVQNLVQGKMITNSLYFDFILDIAKTTNNAQLAFTCLSKLLKSIFDEQKLLLLIEEVRNLCKSHNEVYENVLGEKDNYEQFLLKEKSIKVRQSYSEFIYEAISVTKNSKFYFEFLERNLAKCADYWDKLESFLVPLIKLAEKDEIDHSEWMNKIMNFLTLKLTETLPSRGRNLNYILKSIDLSPFFKIIVTILKHNDICRNEYRGTLLSQDFFRSLLSSKKNTQGIIAIWLMLTETSLPKFIQSITINKSWTNDELAAFFIFGSHVYKENPSLLTWSLESTIVFDMNKLSDFIAAINDRITRNDPNLEAALMSKIAFITEHWILSRGENVRRNTWTLYRTTYQNNWSETQRSLVKTICKKMFEKLPQMTEISVAVSNIHEAPIEIYFSILKWSVQFSDGFEFAIKNSKYIINAMSKFKSNDQLCDKFMTFVIMFLDGVVQRGEPAKQFFENGSYSRFIDVLFESKFFAQQSSSSRDICLRIILKLTPNSCFSRFIKSSVFDSAVSYYMMSQSQVKDDILRFVMENISKETEKKVYKTLFHRDYFKGHCKVNSSHYFKLCTNVMKEYPDLGERFVSEGNFDILVKNLTHFFKKNLKIGNEPVEKIHLLTNVVVAVGSLSNTSKAKNEMVKKLKSSTDLIANLLKNGFSSNDANFFCAACKFSESLIVIEMLSTVLSNWDSLSRNITMETLNTAMSLIRLVSVVNTNDKAIKIVVSTAILSQFKTAPPYAFPDICIILKPFVDEESIYQDFQKILTRVVTRHPDPYYFRKYVRDYLFDFIEKGEKPEPFCKACLKLVKGAYANVVANNEGALVDLRSLMEFLLELSKRTKKTISNIGLTDDQKQILAHLMSKSKNPIAPDILYLLTALQE